MKRREKRLFFALLCALLLSMAVTEGLLLIQGRWREAIPLHLCSLSAIGAAVLTQFESQLLLDFLWYLGMPGAALALVFPAPASSVCQGLLNASYITTHAMILVIPCCRMALGMRPRKGKTAWMMSVLLGIAPPVLIVNRLLGTDFLFLSAPPIGTPLEAVFHLGYPLYLAALFVLMLLCCIGMEWLSGCIFRRDFKEKRQ